MAWESKQDVERERDALWAELDAARAQIIKQASARQRWRSESRMLQAELDAMKTAPPVLDQRRVSLRVLPYPLSLMNRDF